MGELIKRSLFGGIYVLIVVGTIVFLPALIPALFAIFSVMCFLETTALCGYKKPPASLWIVWLGIWLSVIFPYFALYTLSVSGLASVYSLLANKQSRKAWIKSIYVIQPFALAVYTLQIDWITPYFLLFVFMTIWLNDTGAYLSGKKFGKRLLAPKISPKKTWEGFIGGSILAMIIMILPFPFFSDFETLHKLMAAGLIAISATLGDLIQSRMKRKAGVKDSGKIMPGHGGAFDRLDSFIFALPIALFFYINIYHL